MNKLQILLANKHTTGAAVIYAIGHATASLGPAWFPSHANELVATGQWLSKAAVMYGLAMAGDAGKAFSQTPQDKTN